MKIRLLVSTNDKYGQHTPGKVIDVPGDSGAQLVAKGFAEVVPEVVPEVIPAVEGKPTGDIQTPEDELPQHETAVRRRRAKPYTT